MRDDPKDIWKTDYSAHYEAANYGSGLAGMVMRKSHELVERAFDSNDYFEKVLEVGSGSGVHLNYVRHRFNEYLMTDSSSQMLDQTRSNVESTGVRRSVEDATSLSFDDASFDRLIACHVLEHLYRPHDVLKEWARVLKPGGTLSLVLPCDPGLAWRLGRHLGPRARAKKNGLQYDYVMAREHVNAIGNLVNFINYYFDDTSEIWWPTRIASIDLNLIYTVNIKR